MKLKCFLAVLLFAALCVQAQADDSPLAIKITSGINIPLAGDGELFNLGGGANIRGAYSLPNPAFLSVGADIGYSLAPLNTGSFSSLSFIFVGANLGVNFNVLPKLSLIAFGEAGYFFSFFNEDPGSTGSNPFASAGLGISYRLSPTLSLGLEGSYRNFFGLYKDAHVALGAQLHLPSKTSKPVRTREKLPVQPEPLQEEGNTVEIVSVEFANIFPVFFKYYDKNPIGEATLKNLENVPVEDIKTSLFVKQYMDNPKATATIERLEPGEEVEIDLYGLFTNSVLGITEGTKVSALINISYRRNGETVNKEYIETIRLQNRNAVTWDDDRKACAFVTAKDPVVLKFAKNVTGMIKEESFMGVESNMLLATALHEALDIYGINYIVDPTTPYVEFYGNKMAIDYLQFPKQTLEFTAGDCDDISILYASLLEAVGVETAFVTTPGHIFIAFALSASPEEARKNFLYPDDLIFMNNKVWIPVEITLRRKGFLKAWEAGAKEWREAAASNQSGFIPMHTSWEIYEPVGFPGESSIDIPDRDKIVSNFRREMSRFIEREIDPRVARIKSRINQDQNDVKAVNELGILYAKYGLFDSALNQFSTILKRIEYLPALVNTGNIYFLRNEMRQAQQYFARAQALSPNNPKVLLSVARVNHELENYGTARDAYNRLKEVAPDIASRFEYVALRGQSESRAASREELKGVVLWAED